MPSASPLPPLQSRWIGDAVGGEVPEEPDADCANCPLTTPASHALGIGFDEVTRCCTYAPELANFLVGRALRESDPDGSFGRDSLRTRIAQRVGVTPLGLSPPDDHALLYRNAPGAFGRSRALRCPHHRDDGGCGIWQHRNATCATWFCRHTRGSRSLAFWNALRELLTVAERSLARDCALALDLGDDALRWLFPVSSGVGESGDGGIDPRSLDRRVDDASMAAIWGRWHGRVEDYYVACADRCDVMGWAEVSALGGVELRVRELLLAKAYADLRDDRPPLVATVGGFRVLRVLHDEAVLAGYRPIDPVVVPGALLPLLGRFDGRPSAEVLAELEERDGVVLPPEELRRLADSGVLVGG